MFGIIKWLPFIISIHVIIVNIPYFLWMSFSHSLLHFGFECMRDMFGFGLLFIIWRSFHSIWSKLFSMKFFKAFCQIIPFREFWCLVHFQRKCISKSLIKIFLRYFPFQNNLFCFCLALASFRLRKKKFDFSLSKAIF